jgi:hypothetical protein
VRFVDHLLIVLEQARYGTDTLGGIGISTPARA